MVRRFYAIGDIIPALGHIVERCKRSYPDLQNNRMADEQKPHVCGTVMRFGLRRMPSCASPLVRLHVVVERITVGFSGDPSLYTAVTAAISSSANDTGRYNPYPTWISSRAIKVTIRDIVYHKYLGLSIHYCNKLQHFEISH